MHVHHCLAHVAQLELNALVQEVKSTVNDLKRQRESAMQALEAAQGADERANLPPDETGAQVARLLDGLHRLNAALDQVLQEIERIEAAPTAPSAEPVILLRLPLAQVLDESHSLLDVSSRPTL